MKLLQSKRKVGIREPGEEVLPGYEVVELLTEGKRLLTYDVFSQERGCRCIVKILRADRADEERVRDATIREGMLATSLTHPHIVRGYELVTDPIPAVVLETLGGDTLAALIDERDLPLADVVLLAEQLGSALGYLHAKGWLHCDVKPANIIIEAGKAILIDLSLAARPGAGKPGSGTRGYIAPEQARGEGLSAATDVWGLGVTLIEALTGVKPHGDEATWDTMKRIKLIHGAIPDPPGPLAGVPAEVDRVLRSCLERNPADRPTLAELVAGLRVGV